MCRKGPSHVEPVSGAAAKTPALCRLELRRLSAAGYKGEPWLFIGYSDLDRCLLFPFVFSLLAAAETTALGARSAVSSCHLEILRDTGRHPTCADLRMNAWTAHCHYL